MDTEEVEISEQDLRLLGTEIWNVQTSRFIADVAGEVVETTAHNAPMNSAHEGYAVLLEEVEELWQEVKRKPALRNKAAMWQECVQIAAMAYRFATEIADGAAP